MNHPPLKPCPFCGESVRLQQASSEYNRIHGKRNSYGVVCRSTKNLGFTCCMEQVPSASIKAAVMRWNMRDGVADIETIEWFKESEKCLSTQ
jgi:hypothetical protein